VLYILSKHLYLKKGAVEKIIHYQIHYKF